MGNSLTRILSAMIKVLNLYAGIGGNRKYWDNCKVTSVEYSPAIAKIYQDFYPNDTVVIGDAHEYLLNNYQNFDFIWASPPCQSHSRMIRGGRNRRPRYPDFKLYEEIFLLQNWFDGQFVVENVVPFYTPLIGCNHKIGRHMFWSNLDFTGIEEVKQPSNFINLGTVAGSERLKKWLGLNYNGNIYYEGNHDPSQVLRNCVHTDLGKAIIDRFDTHFIPDIKIK